MKKRPRPNTLIELLRPAHWNALSYFYSLFSLPTIGSPICFKSFFGMQLEEVNLLTVSEGRRREFLSFCYPQDMPDRQREISYDRCHWERASNFIIRTSDGKIAGCAQFIPRNNLKLPVEYAVVAGTEHPSTFDVAKNSEGLNSAEVYRLRRSFDIDPAWAPAVVSMLFKAIWAKVIQTQTRYIYLTCDPVVPELRNLYMKKLAFEDFGTRVLYGECPKPWTLLRMDCLKHENFFACRSVRHFQLQTYCRANLKDKRLRLAA